MWNKIIRYTPVIFLSAVLVSAAPAYANKLSEAIQSDTWMKEADELLLEADGTLRGDAEKQVKKTWKKLRAAEKERFRLALLLQSYTEKGFDTDLAAQYADDALLTTDYGTLSLNSDDTDESAGEEETEVELTDDSYADDTSAVSDLIACRSQAELSEIFARILESADGTYRRVRLLEEMGEVLQGETLETVLPYALQAEDAGWDGASLLHQVWVPDESPADTAAYLCAMEDDPQRALLLKAAGLVFSEPDEMLQYISSCAQLGVMPSACYPEGADLSLDLSKLNRNAVSRADVDQTRLLILNRTEKTPDPSAFFVSGLSGGDSNHPEPENCRVRLETGWMDQVPAKCLPSSLDEVNTILLMDNQYFEDGTMTVETTTSFGGNTGGSTTKEYPVYGAVQVGSCFDWPSQSLLYSFSGNYTAPPEVPEEDRTDSSYGFSMVPDMVWKYYKAEMDPAWAAESMQEQLDLLSKNDWSTDVSSEISSGNGRFSSIDDWNQIIQELYPGRAGYLSEDQFTVQLDLLDRIKLDWASFAGSDTCDCYYVIFWKVTDAVRYYWQVIAPGESTNFTFGAMPGVSYNIGIWQGTQTQPVVDGSMAYYTTEVDFDAVSVGSADAGVIVGNAFIEVRHGEERETLEGALDPALISEEGADVKFCVPLEPVDGKERDVRMTYCLLSPNGHVYYDWCEFTMYDEQVVYNQDIFSLLLQNSEDMGGTVESGDWSAFASIDGVLIERADFSIG